MVKRYKRIESQFMETFVRDLWKSLINLSNILKKLDINFTVIGGAARNQYGAIKITEDIDILVDIKDKDKMLHLPIGFIRELSNGRGKVYTLHDPKTKIEVIYTGEEAGREGSDVPYINPKKISNNIKNIPFLTLENLIRYKLASGLYGKGRLKDFADIQFLIEMNDLERNYADSFRKDLKNKYIEIWIDTME